MSVCVLSVIRVISSWHAGNASTWVGSAVSTFKSEWAVN